MSREVLIVVAYLGALLSFGRPAAAPTADHPAFVALATPTAISRPRCTPPLEPDLEPRCSSTPPTPVASAAPFRREGAESLPGVGVPSTDHHP